MMRYWRWCLIVVNRAEHVRYGQIQLVQVQSSDYGRYTVVASDVYSNSSVSFSLFVNGTELFVRIVAATIEQSSPRRLPQRSLRQSPRVYTTGDRRRDDRSDSRGDDRPVYTPSNVGGSGPHRLEILGGTNCTDN